MPHPFPIRSPVLLAVAFAFAVEEQVAGAPGNRRHEQLRRYFPITPDNFSPDAPIRFFETDEFTALLTTVDGLSLQVCRRIEK